MDKNFVALLKDWNLCHAAHWRLAEEDLFWNTEQQKFLQYSVLRTPDATALYATATELGVSFGLTARNLWLAFFVCGSRQAAAGLLLALEREAANLGKASLQFCGDEFHFLPGLPLDSACASDEYLLAACAEQGGFTADDCCDFTGSLRENEKMDAYIDEARREAAGEKLQLLEAEGDGSRLHGFLSKNFPGRWSREPAFSPGDGGRWFLLVDPSGRLLAFSRVAVRRDVVKGARTPSALRLPLDEAGEWRKDDACLGPIGVASEYRGRGYGKIILGLSLQELIKAGAAHICIDWTNAYQYYSSLGLQERRHYRLLHKSL